MWGYRPQDIHTSEPAPHGFLGNSMHAHVLQEKKTEDLRRLVKVLAADAYRTAHETHRAMVKQVNFSGMTGCGANASTHMYPNICSAVNGGWHDRMHLVQTRPGPGQRRIFTFWTIAGQ